MEEIDLCIDCAFRAGQRCKLINGHIPKGVYCPYWIEKDYEEIQTDEEGNADNS